MATDIDQRTALIFAANAEISALAAKLRTPLSPCEYRKTLAALADAKARKADLYLPSEQSGFGG